MNPVPTFLDFEASSLSSASYPIEVAWNSADGSIEEHLISPAGIDAWTDWDPESEKVHGIPRSTLLELGEAPFAVWRRMEVALAGATIYTDAPAYDGRWLVALVAACPGVRPAVELHDVDDLLASIVSPWATNDITALERIFSLKQEARRQLPARHRAAADVAYLVHLWRLTVQAAR